MSNYSATVVRISNLRPHTNADRLICTNIFGNNVIVGKETQIGDLGLFFPLESQIGKEFAEANDLLRRKDADGKPAGGMFDDNRRVRAQKFRGEQSMGFWIPMESLIPFSGKIGKVIDPFPEGSEIEKIGDYIVSQKYIPRNSRMPGAGGRKEGRKPRESRIIPDQFRFHFDTAQLGKNIHKLKPTDLVVITWKLHGTSAIAAHVLVKRSLSWLEKLLKKFVSIVDTQYDYVYASRRVVKNEFQETKDHYYGTDLWSDVGKQHFEGKLHTGETIYYEIVGYTKDGAPIQKDFDYKCLNGENKVFVYRITQTAVDGSVIELQWNQLKERCAELGVEHVPEIMYGEADLFAGAGEATGFDLDAWQKQYLEFLRQKFVYDQDSQFCMNKVPEEGVCVRKEGLDIEVFKLKSFRFLEYETKSLDKGEVDIETEQSEPTAEDEYLVNV